jgi:Protein of unknown function (DUF2845)
MRNFVLATSCLALAAMPALAQSGFRCGDQLVDLGSSQDTVLAQCGEPTQVAEGADDIGEGVAVPVEEWLYNFGPTTLPAILVFRNGSLATVRTLDGFPST